MRGWQPRSHLALPHTYRARNGRERAMPIWGTPLVSTIATAWRATCVGTFRLERGNRRLGH